MANKEVNIQKYVDDTKKKLDRFIEWWLDANRLHPKDFPLELGIGDWNEQFEFFEE